MFQVFILALYQKKDRSLQFRVLKNTSFQKLKTHVKKQIQHYFDIPRKGAIIINFLYIESQT